MAPSHIPWYPSCPSASTSGGRKERARSTLLPSALVITRYNEPSSCVPAQGDRVLCGSGICFKRRKCCKTPATVTLYMEPCCAPGPCHTAEGSNDIPVALERARDSMEPRGVCSVGVRSSVNFRVLMGCRVRHCGVGIPPSSSSSYLGTLRLPRVSGKLWLDMSL